MIVDTSALVAVVFHEPERDRMVDALLDAETVRMGAPNWFELCMVVDDRAVAPVKNGADRLLDLFGIEIVPFDAGLAELARQAHRVFGRGNHPAKLNVGDCMAYALARITGEPLLFKGDDLARTDIAAVLA